MLHPRRHTYREPYTQRIYLFYAENGILSRVLLSYALAMFMTLFYLSTRHLRNDIMLAKSLVTERKFFIPRLPFYILCVVYETVFSFFVQELNVSIAKTEVLLAGILSADYSMNLPPLFKQWICIANLLLRFVALSNFAPKYARLSRARRFTPTQIPTT